MMFRIRGNAKHLVAGDLHRKGKQFQQSGLWDDRLVCATHESAFSAADDYTIDLCRRIHSEAKLVSKGRAIEVSNPKPDLLLKFTCATVWRYVASRFGRAANLSLGPFTSRFQNYLFSKADPPAQVLLGLSNLTSPDGRLLEVAIAPYRSRLRAWNVWHFNVGPLDAFVKTDQPPFPSIWNPYLANDNDPLTLMTMDPLRLDRLPKLQPIFRNMLGG